MTKYILNSGGSKRYPDKADKFNKEIVKDLGSSPRILFCFFATPRELWEEKFTQYSQRFLLSMESGVSPEIDLAFPDKFFEQVKILMPLLFMVVMISFSCIILKNIICLQFGRERL